MNLILIGLLLFEISLISFYEKKITPFTILGVPFFIVLVISYISSKIMSFIDVDPFIIVLWIICMLVFWIGGQFGKLIALPIKFNTYCLHKKNRDLLIFFITTFLALLLLFNAIRIAVTLDNPMLISTDYYSKQIVLGIYEWVRTLNMIFLIYLLGNINKNKKKFLIPIILILLTLFIFQIKGMIIMPIMAGIIYRVLNGNMKINKNLVLIIIVLSIATFLIVYALPYLFSKQFDFVFSKDFLEFIFNHILSFLNSGILGFSAKYKQGAFIADSQRLQIVAPFMNILRHFTDWNRYSIENAPLLINYSEGFSSNVGTIFGTFYIHLKGFCTYLFAFFLGFLSYFQMNLANKSKNIWDKIIYCNLLSILAFGWFEYYFWHQYIISMFIIMLIFSLLSKLKIKY